MSVALLRAMYAVQPVHYGHIGTIYMCADYQSVHDYLGQFTTTC